MVSQLNYSHTQPPEVLWDIPALTSEEPNSGLTLEMTGKVVFITVQGMREAPALAAEYIQAGAFVALLDVAEWVLHLPRANQALYPLSFGQTVRCPSWVSAVEEVIAQFGPINLWLDTRAMAWPAVSRTDGPTRA